MPNIHTPERLANETREQYRDRRAASKAAVREMVRGPSWLPDVWLGQHTNPTRNAERRARREARRGL